MTTIDISGPEGNAFCLMGRAMFYAKQLGLDPNPILTEMKSGSYDTLLLTFEKYFGKVVKLVDSISEDYEEWDDDFGGEDE